jgi:lambda family phage portal protein
MLARIATASRAFRRSFDAAGPRRWPRHSQVWAQNSQSLAARNIITKRSNYLSWNSPTGAAFVEGWVTNLIGSGPTVRSGHGDKDVRADLESRFAEWCTSCNVEGVGDLSGMLETAVRSTVTSGESLFHFAVDGGGNLGLRLLASEQLDSSRTVPSLGMTGDGPNVVSGVEKDRNGKIAAYWILDDAPDQVWASVAPSKRVDAVDIAHIFKKQFPGQVRGLSWFTAIASRLVELDTLEDSALVRARCAAIMAGFVSGDPENSMFDPDIGTDGSVTPPELTLEPGTMTWLPPGATVTFSQLGDMSTVTDLMRHMLRSIAAGGGMSYEALTADLSQVNYSSARLGAASFQRRIKALQGSLLTAQLLTPIWRRWVLLEILTGRIHAPDFQTAPLAYLNATWLFPGFPSVDPLKEAKANALDIASRTRSRAEIIADHGRDVSDVDEEIGSDPLFVSDPVAAAALLAQPDQQESQNA